MRLRVRLLLEGGHGSGPHRAKTGIRGVSQSVPQLSRSFTYGYSPQQEQYHRPGQLREADWARNRVPLAGLRFTSMTVQAGGLRVREARIGGMGGGSEAVCRLGLPRGEARFPGAPRRRPEPRKKSACQRRQRGICTRLSLPISQTKRVSGKRCFRARRLSMVNRVPSSASMPVAIMRGWRFARRCRRLEPFGEARHAARWLERILRTHQPPHIVEAKLLQRRLADVNVAVMRRD